MNSNPNASGTQTEMQDVTDMSDISVSKCDPNASGTDGPLLVFHGDVSSLWQFPPIFRPSQPYPVQPYTFPSSYSNLSEFKAGNATTSGSYNAMHR